MSDSPRRAEDKEFFRERYGRTRQEASREVERSVLGHDVGVNGYTTVAEAGALVEHLGLSPTSLLLDLGSGRGWPGSYLSRLGGCRVVLTDIPLEALRADREYVETREVGARARIVAAEGGALPFAPDLFDAISHADVFC